jgi:hypothetical protein
VEESAYDNRRPITSDFWSLAREIEAAVVERYGKAGVPLWLLVASSAYGSFLREELGDEFFALTWDASTRGWAALLRWWVREAGSEEASADRDVTGRGGRERAALP